jgi:hypothetical protein
MLALILLLLIAAAVVIYALGRYEEAHLEDSFDDLGRKRVGK